MKQAPGKGPRFTCTYTPSSSSSSSSSPTTPSNTNSKVKYVTSTTTTSTQNNSSKANFKLPETSTTTSSAPPILLTDEQMKEFLINGYLSLRTSSLSEEFHKKLYDEALIVIDKEGNPGNNIYPRIPELSQVYDDPTIRGALISTLGPNYTMQAHRFPHLTVPGTKAQQWHKDSFFGFGKPLRHHQVRYVMAMYYPQDTVINMGPTAIKPRTQYDVIDPKRAPKSLPNVNSKDDDKLDVYYTCQAGSVLLVHYDIVHKGTANKSSHSKRLMFKFQFNRLEEPTQPTWNHDTSTDSWSAEEAGDLQPIVKHVWNWLRGAATSIPVTIADSVNVDKWKDQLNSMVEKKRLNAAYNLASCGRFDLLLDRIYSSEETFRKEAAYALTACQNQPEVIDPILDMMAKADNEEVLYSLIFVLFEMGKLSKVTAAPLLIKWGMDQSVSTASVKQYICEALGTMFSDGDPSDNSVIAAVKYLTDVLSQRNGKDSKGRCHARLTAALALARIGKGSVTSISELSRALQVDNNRYVNANALLALQRIGTEEAKVIVNKHFASTGGWCNKTTVESPY